MRGSFWKGDGREGVGGTAERRSAKEEIAETAEVAEEVRVKGRFLRKSLWVLVAAAGILWYENSEATRWLLSPAFPNEGGKRFAEDLLKEFGGETAVSVSQVSHRWKSAHPDENGYMNLLKHHVATDDKLVYALATFEAKDTGIAAWRFGSDDGIKVWVNGKLCYSSGARRGARKDSDECLSRIAEGDNTVLLKIDNATGEWGFYFRLAEVFPQEKGRRALLVSLIVPPYLLYGSQYPIEQWASGRLLNNGTEALETAALRLELEGETVGQTVVDKLSPLTWAECRVRLKVATNAAADSARGKAKVLVGEEELSPPEPFTVQVREVHPLLAGRLEDQDGVLRFIHATDTHVIAPNTVLNNVRTADNLTRAVCAINKMEPPPDFVMVTGDLTLDSTAGLDYFGQLMEPLRMPWLAIPGNHDKPGGEMATLHLFGRGGLPLYYSFDHAGCHIVALDGQPPTGSLVDGGFIPEEIEWLNRDLQLAKGKETLVFVHQHPLFTRVKGRDDLVDWPELVKVLEGFPQVKWVFCGHAHVDYFAKQRGIRYVMTTATAYQFSPKEVPYFANEPGVRLMEHRNGKTTSRFLRIDGTWRDDPSLMNCPDFSLRTPQPASSTK